MTAIKTFNVTEGEIPERNGFTYQFVLQDAAGVYSHTHLCRNRGEGLEALKQMGFEVQPQEQPPHA